MKKILSVLCGLSLITTSAIGLTIDENTALKWNPQVVIMALAHGALSSTSDSKEDIDGYYKILEHLLLIDKFSVVYATEVCKEYCYEAIKYFPCSRRCEEFANGLVEESKIEICKTGKDTLWDEKAQICIPGNPCENSNFEKYCIRDFKDFQSPINTDFYIDFVNIYAATHGINCKAVPTKSNWTGQDYVVCDGEDVRVFEFGDTNDGAFFMNKELDKYLIKYFCVASNGKLISDNTCLPQGNTCYSADLFLTKMPALAIRTDSDCSLTVDKKIILDRDIARDNLYQRF